MLGEDDVLVHIPTTTHPFDSILGSEESQCPKLSLDLLFAMKRPLVIQLPAITFTPPRHPVQSHQIPPISPSHPTPHYHGRSTLSLCQPISCTSRIPHLGPMATLKTRPHRHHLPPSRAPHPGQTNTPVAPPLQLSHHGHHLHPAAPPIRPSLP